jgi:hypothetical protein
MGELVVFLYDRCWEKIHNVDLMLYLLYKEALLDGYGFPG